MASRAKPSNSGATRCAVYTRKSTEEGLEQVFNTLHAQREACEAYVLSQRHEGWSVIPTPYDDGGFSGGSMERPALQELLADIRSGLIDVVVVYKVDRLTRSLSDFAKIVEIFDAQGVSFVSVTQAFNTTTSMGRLTLNVLLSFAQFEREVTAERIRDKMAASKKKGMWMGGFVPLGYDAVDKKLVINEREANDVRTIFDLYLKLGNVRLVKAEADKLGIQSKRRNVKDERRRGGGPLWRSHIYGLLTNPLYLGKIRYRGEIYDGEHDAIVDPEIWELVQAGLIDNGKRTRGRTNAMYVSLLAGLLFTEEGASLTPSHAVKDGKRYRYYVERPADAENKPRSAAGTVSSQFTSIAMPSSVRRRWRIPAHDIEAVVLRAIAHHLRDRDAACELVGGNDATASMLPEHLNRAAALAAALESGMPRDQLSLLQTIVSRVTIHDTAIVIALRRDRLVEQLTGKVMAPDNDREALEITIPVSFRRRGVEMKLVLDSTDPQQRRTPDPGLVQLVSRAHDWFGRIASGVANGPADIAAQDKAARTDVSRALPLAFLAPDIVRAILEGRHPPELTPSVLVRSAPRLPSHWNTQRRILGFPQD